MTLLAAGDVDGGRVKGVNRMASVKVGLENLSAMDSGMTAHLFNRALKQAIADCVDRPSDDAARTVMLKLTIKPQETDGVCETVLMDAQVQTKLPTPRTKQYQAGVKGDGTIVVNPASLDDVRQRTIDEA